MNEFAKRLREQCEPKYASNDDAHLIDHADAVYQQCLFINATQKLELDVTYLAIVAYCHDLFADFRDNHHELVYQHLKTTKEWFMRGIDTADREMLARAVREHRASYKGHYTSIYSEVLASADKGAPTSLLEMIERSCKYAKSKLNKTDTEATIHAFEHMKEKFGSKGYARYPSIYRQMYSESLRMQQMTIDGMRIPSEKEVLGRMSMATLLEDMLK